MFKEKIIKYLSSKAFMIGISFFGLYLLATGTSWAIFSYLINEPNLSGNGAQNGARVDLSQPKTEECPMNGKLFTKSEKAIWEGRRPLTVVIENHFDSRPTQGLSSADVVYEAVAEGGITRFLSVFYCGVAAQETKVAPVRSARVYYINWATEYGKNPLFLHIGGANNICKECPGGVKTSGQIAKEVDAYKLLDTLGWWGKYGNDLNGETNIGYPAVKREQNRLGTDKVLAWEHTVVGYTDEVYEEAEKRGFSYKDSEGIAWDKDFVKWRFSDDKPLNEPKARDISFEFWGGKSDYDVKWQYDKDKNYYFRFNGGQEYLDFNNKERITAKNVLIQFVKEKGPVDKEGHMFYTTIGEGEVLIFQNGDVIEGTWKKDSQAGRTRFFDKGGREISFVRGVIWIEAVPAGNKISY